MKIVQVTVFGGFRESWDVKLLVAISGVAQHNCETGV
jgi:hypothetical protein